MLRWFGRRLSDAQKGEEGFTLIELLVVVIIIGILVTIAIPIYLAQRENAQDRAAQSDLRNAATAQVVSLSDTGAYQNVVSGGAGAQDDLYDFGFRKTAGVTLDLSGVNVAADTFCMDAQWTGSGREFHISSAETSVTPGACP